MPMPTRTHWSIFELAARWDCTTAQILEHAQNEHFEIVAPMPPFQSNGTWYAGICRIEPTDVAGHFRRDGTAPDTVRIQRAKPIRKDPREQLTAPLILDEAMHIPAHSLRVTTEEVKTVEGSWGIRNGTLQGYKAPDGAPDWLAAFQHIAIRLAEGATWRSQSAMARELQDFFARRSPTGDFPDERTVTRRTQEFWKILMETLK